MILVFPHSEMVTMLQTDVVISPWLRKEKPRSSSFPGRETSELEKQSVAPHPGET